MVLPFNKNSLNFFEGTTRKDAPMEPMPQMNAPPRKFLCFISEIQVLFYNIDRISVRPMMHPSIGLPLPMPRGGPMEGHYRFQSQGPVLLPGRPTGIARQPMPIVLGQRGPLQGGPMILSRMPGPPNHVGVHPQQSVIVMQQQPQRPGVPPGTTRSRLLH